MNIVEAIKAANGGKITRKAWKEHFSPGTSILPTDTADCCLLFGKFTPDGAKRWNPRLEDLTAEDWECVKSSS